MADNVSEKLDFARSILEHNSNLINLADTKAGILLGINGIILALLFSIDQNALSESAKVTLICTGALLTISSIFAVLTIFPRLTRPDYNSNIYFMYLKGLDVKEYINSWRDLKPSDILEDYLRNIHNLAILQEKKFKFLRASVVIIIIAIGVLAISLGVYYGTEPSGYITSRFEGNFTLRSPS